MSSPTFNSESRPEPIVVLVADDVPEIRELARQWLADAGYAVITVGTGRDALRVLRAEPIQVVVTDVLMPDGDGLEVMAEMKRMKSPAGILAVSGGGDLLRADDCLKIARGLGAHEVLMKPFLRLDFMAAFERVLRSRRPPAVP
ncbi:response regulator [Horticoccus sp. 23ND18S-11]|uniref:response regulator n=1 Tax=Horticoccus sp. 23ND18S-11 TaxID=3391832 RepID=UPI0039C98319